MSCGQLRCRESSWGESGKAYLGRPAIVTSIVSHSGIAVRGTLVCLGLDTSDFTNPGHFYLTEPWRQKSQAVCTAGSRPGRLVVWEGLRRQADRHFDGGNGVHRHNLRRERLPTVDVLGVVLRGSATCTVDTVLIAVTAVFCRINAIGDHANHSCAESPQ